MKKIILVLFLMSSVLSAQTSDKELNKLVAEVNQATERNNQQAKVMEGITGCVKLSIGYWGFSQKNSYGNVTGVMFSISGIADIYSALK